MVGTQPKGGGESEASKEAAGTDGPAQYPI